jgi:hypothetical protein
LPCGYCFLIGAVCEKMFLEVDFVSIPQVIKAIGKGV